MIGRWCCCLSAGGRGLLRVRGPESKALLQGLITNDMESLVAPGGAPGHCRSEMPEGSGATVDEVPRVMHEGAMNAAFLNAKGRMMAETMVHLPSKEDQETFFLDLSLDVLPRIFKYLRMAKLRRKVEIEDVSSDYQVWSVAEEDPGDLEELEQRVLFRSFVADPRDVSLGTRVIIQNASVPVLREELVARSVPVVLGDTYHEHRILRGIPEGLEVDGAIPLEFNLDLFHGVSFHKGCYTGQELTARTHFRGLVRKRLFPIVLGDPLGPDSVGSEIKLSKTDEKVGKLVALSSNGTAGLALLKMREHMAEEWSIPCVFDIRGVSSHVKKFPCWFHKIKRSR